VKGVQPEATRILLTGYADKENAIKAINDVGLYQYIEKPWENDDLKLIIRNGLEKRILLKRLEDKITEVNRAHEELMSLQRDILKAFA
jgi:response regulator RpfG family c-di-GMP phosphodiesterase